MFKRVYLNMMQISKNIKKIIVDDCEPFFYRFPDDNDNFNEMKTKNNKIMMNLQIQQM